MDPSESLVGGGLLGEDRFVRTPDGRRLRVMVAGDGDDLIMLESGLGASGLHWGPVHERIGEHTLVATYERAGYGASDPDPVRPRDLERLADDLQTVVDALPHRRLVLVGHSWGGPIVRTLAARLNTQGRPVAGLLLVDPTDEGALQAFDSPLNRFLNPLLHATAVPLTRLGVLRFLLRRAFAELPQPLRDAVVDASGTVEAAKEIIAENPHMGRSLRRFADAPPQIGDVPLTVISGQWSGSKFGRRMRAPVLQAHRDTAQAHPGGRLVRAERSGHLVQVTEPELVATEALALLDRDPSPPR